MRKDSLGKAQNRQVDNPIRPHTPGLPHVIEVCGGNPGRLARREGFMEELRSKLRSRRGRKCKVSGNFIRWTNTEVRLLHPSPDFLKLGLSDLSNLERVRL